MRRRVAILSHVRRHVVGYLALFLVLGGVGHAAFISSTGEIKACVIPTTGGTQPNTRIIDETATCASGQTLVQWNQTGPPGPGGPGGPPGAPGPAGAAGPAGPAGDFSAPSQGAVDGEPSAADLGPAGTTNKKRKRFARRRVFLVGHSGPAKVVGLNWSGLFLGKEARIKCPANAPVLINTTVVVTNGQPPGGEETRQWVDDGRQAATHLFYYGPSDESTPSASLEALTFNLQGECADV
jgi:hypothetical protein